MPALLRELRVQCPGLTFLSLLQNPGVPHELTGQTAAEYAAHRCMVAAALPHLAFLDAQRISAEERAAGQQLLPADLRKPGGGASPATPRASEVKATAIASPAPPSPK